MYVSLLAGLGTSLYFVPEIIEYSGSGYSSPLLFIGGLSVQALHDAVCIFFFVLFLGSFKKESFHPLLALNCLHCIIMMLFCYYKRCVLTLLYNHMMGIDMCRRYIPIWQRVYNVFFHSLTGHEVCINDYRNTYLWLNNHILQSFLVFSSNAYRLLWPRPLHASGKNSGINTSLSTGRNPLFL